MVTDFEDLIGNFYGRFTYCCGIGIIHVGQHRIQRPGGGEGRGPRNMKSIYLFYDLFLQGWGGACPPRPPPGSASVGSILTLDL